MNLNSPRLPVPLVALYDQLQAELAGELLGDRPDWRRAAQLDARLKELEEFFAQIGADPW